MSKRRRVPEDLMGTILGEGSGFSSDERASSWSTGSRSADRRTAASASDDEGTIFWEEQPERVGTTFNLSKQVGKELDKLRLELQLEEGIRSSNSEITEVALRIAVEDARERGTESELVKRLSGRPADRAKEDTGAAHGALGGTTDEVGWSTRRRVDDSGRIFETTYNRNGEIAGEEAVGDVADLPVEAEYLDEEGRFRSLANDELGNTFEWVVDNEFNTIGARLVRGTGRPADRAKEDTGAAHGALGGTTDEVGWTTRRRVDDSGRIFETTYNRNGEIAGEEAVGDVADLPVEAEYLDEEGRFRSLANDELGNTFEWVVDDEFNTIGARLVRGTGRPADRAKEDIGAAHGALGGTTDEVGWTTRRRVDDSGRIFETTYNRNGEIAGEEAVGDVADLPVEAEYLDEEGRFRSLANDELGNTFEWVVDDEFNTIGARLVRGTD